MPTLKELVKKYQLAQPETVDQLTERTPVLDSLDFRQATHALSNVFEKIYSITGGGYVDLDAPLGIVNKSSGYDTTFLIKMGGRMIVGKDKATQFGGAAAYFADQTQYILPVTGMGVESDLLYKNFRQYAIDNARVEDIGGTASAGTSGLYSILFVRFTPGENNGLYPNDGFPSGHMLKSIPLQGGNLHNIGPNNYPGSEYKNGTMGYAMDLESFFGWQIANSETVYAFVNCKDGKIPSAKQIDNALLEVKADANTRILCHPKMRSLLVDQFRDFILPAEITVNNIVRKLSAWNDIPIMDTYNFLKGTETKVTVS